MPLSFMGDCVTVVRPASKAVRGSAVPDWDNAVEHTERNCQITAMSTSQDRNGRVVQVTDRKRLRASYGADIQAGDRIVWGGAVYLVDGEPHRTKSPTGRASSLACDLVAWKG